MSDFKARMHQNRFRLGLCPRPRWEKLQRSPDPLAAFKGPTSKGIGRVAREDRDGQEGRKRKEKKRGHRLYIYIFLRITYGYQNIRSASFSFVTIRACDRTDKQNYDCQDRASIATLARQKPKISLCKVLCNFCLSRLLVSHVTGLSCPPTSAPKLRQWPQVPLRKCPATQTDTTERITSRIRGWRKV